MTRRSSNAIAGGAGGAGAPAGDGGLQVDVLRQPGHRVVGAQLLLPVRRQGRP